MKKYLLTAITIISCMLVILCLVQIATLKQQLDQTEQFLSSRISELKSRCDSITQYVENRLQEHVSLLSNVTQSLSDADISNQTAHFTCALTPKEYQPDETSASLVINGQEHSMTLLNNEYTLQISLPLFSSSAVEKVMFRENGAVRTEMLNWSISPSIELLPVIEASYSGTGFGRGIGGVYVWSKDGAVRVSASCKAQPFEVQSISLIEKLDDTIINKTPIPLSDNTTQPRADGAVPEDVSKSAASFVVHNSKQFSYPLKRDFEIPYGSTLELYIELLDGFGLLHHVPVECWSINELGEDVDADNWYLRKNSHQIYDADGALIYDNSLD